MAPNTMNGLAPAGLDAKRADETEMLFGFISAWRLDGVTSPEMTRKFLSTVLCQPLAVQDDDFSTGIQRNQLLFAEKNHHLVDAFA